jgi:hypothetical protein
MCFAIRTSHAPIQPFCVFRASAVGVSLAHPRQS